MAQASECSHRTIAEWSALEAEVERLKANTCPDAAVCKTCPCAGEDDARFPGERLRAENGQLRKFAESAAAAFHDLDYERGYLHAKAVLAGTSDEGEAPRG